MAEQQFSHLDGDGKLRMVDITSKEATLRVAQASCLVVSRIDAASLGPSANGFDVIHAARLAGIQAAKRTAELIPLCHPLNLNDIKVDVLAHPQGLEIRAEVVTVNRTGVEMEALTACSFAALSIVSSLVEADPDVRFEELVLLRKSGGKSGDWGRSVKQPE
jgi:cyclic pyranopterin phosphate synthase